jgi:hypothetical protein
MRTFTVVQVNTLKNSKLSLKSEESRFKGNTPVQAAKKVFTQYIRNTRNYKLHVHIREISKKSSKIYSYLIQKIKLEKPIIRFKGQRKEFTIRYSIEAKSIASPKILEHQVGGIIIEDMETGRSIDYTKKRDAKVKKIEEMKQKSIKMLAKILLETFPNEIQKLAEEKATKKVTLKDQVTNLLSFIEEKGKRNALIMAIFLQMELNPKISGGGKDSNDGDGEGDCIEKTMKEPNCDDVDPQQLETAYSKFGSQWKKIYRSNDIVMNRISSKTISTKTDKKGYYNWENEVVYNPDEMEKFTDIISNYGCKYVIKREIEKYCRDKISESNAQKRYDEMLNKKTKDHNNFVWSDSLKDIKDDVRYIIETYLKQKHAQYKHFVKDIEYSDTLPDERSKIMNELKEKDTAITNVKYRALLDFSLTLASGIVTMHSYSRTKEVPTECIILLFGLVQFGFMYKNDFQNILKPINFIVTVVLVLLMYHSAETLSETNIIYNYLTDIYNFTLSPIGQNQLGQGWFSPIEQGVSGVSSLLRIGSGLTQILQHPITTLQKVLTPALFIGTSRIARSAYVQGKKWKDLRSERDKYIESQKRKIRIKKEEIDEKLNDYMGRPKTASQKRARQKLENELDRSAGLQKVKLELQKKQLATQEQQLAMQKQQLQEQRKQNKKRTVNKIQASLSLNGNKNIDGAQNPTERQLARMDTAELMKTVNEFMIPVNPRHSPFLSEEEARNLPKAPGDDPNKPEFMNMMYTRLNNLGQDPPQRPSPVKIPVPNASSKSMKRQRSTRRIKTTG